MLETIKFIKENENWRDLLKTDPYNLTINENENYAILKYSQVNSDFTKQICKECRGLVIDLHTNEPVALSFIKFFNVQEPLADKIDWATAKVQEKVDGSKMLVWFDKYENKWRISTSSQLDAYKANVSDFNITFGQLFDKALLNYTYPGYKSLYDCLDKNYCYTFELVSPESKIVISYPTNLYFIGVRDIRTFEEKNPEDFTNIYPYMCKPRQYPVLKNLKSCLSATEKMGFDEEGFVVVDANYNRVKIKSPTYVQAHYLRGNGVNSLSKILEIIEKNEKDEFLGYFPEYAEYFDDVEKRLITYKNNLKNAINDLKNKLDIEANNWTRKDFADFINTNYKEYAAVLFTFMDTNLIDLFIDNIWSRFSKDTKMKKLDLKYEPEKE